MSAYAMWVLSCDGEAVGARDDQCEISLDDSTQINATEARRSGKEVGWAVRRGSDNKLIDLCPHCVKSFDAVRVRPGLLARNKYHAMKRLA